MARTFSGRPLDTLKRERARLMSIWGSGPRPYQPFEAPKEAFDLVAPISPATLARAARSFPTRTAQTFDGFHPKNFALLDEFQQQVTFSLLTLVGRVGAMPRAIAAILTKLIPRCGRRSTSTGALASNPPSTACGRVAARWRRASGRRPTQSP